MIDDIFVFDNVIHVYDMSDENTLAGEGHAGRSAMLRQTAPGRHPAAELGVDRWDKAWATEEMYELVFAQSPTDMAMAQVVPIFEWYRDFFAPVAAQYAMAAAYPDRVLFCGGADPVHQGVEGALDQLEYQARELGARSFKFYNGHVSGSWRCDDEKLAYPLYQKALDLGIDVIQFHKGTPFGTQPLEPLSPLDLEQAAIDFPQMRFIIHHLAAPYFREVVSIAARHPNIHLALSGNLNMLFLAPRLVQEQMGILLQQVGVHKLLWGSEAALAGGPAPYLKAFMDLEIPEDLRRGYGYPQITREDKERILGRNFAEMMGVDIEAKRRELAGAA